MQGYAYEASSDRPHRRAVDWLSLDEWKMPVAEGLQTTVYEMKKDARNLVEIESHILGADLSAAVSKPVVAATTSAAIIPHLHGVAGRIQAILDRKGQVILYGPPGTGKTYWAMTTARDLGAYHRFGLPYGDLTDDQKEVVIGTQQRADGLVRMCSFHPAYGYKDFLEGYRPDLGE